MEDKTKQIPEQSFNLLTDSVFGEDNIIFKDDFESTESINAKLDQKEVGEHNEESGAPIEEKVTEDKKEATKKSDPVKDEVKEEKPDELVEEQESSLAVFASFLGEKGIVDYDPATFKDSDEGLVELINNSINKGIEEYKSGKPEEIQLFLNFVESGGDPRKFHEVYYAQVSWGNFEIKDEDSAKIVIEEYLKSRGEDDDEIKEKIETFEVGGILEKEAKRNLARLQKEESDYKAQLVEQQKKFDIQQREKARQEYEDFKKDLYSKDEIQGFKLTPSVKDKLWSYMTTIDKKTGLTALQKHNRENANAELLYAYLAMNDWNVNKLAEKEKTKIHSQLADKLRNSTDSRSKIKSGQTENFGEQKDNNFSAFRKIIENNQI